MLEESHKLKEVRFLGFHYVLPHILFDSFPNPILQVMVDFILWNKTLQSEKLYYYGLKIL